MLLYQRLLKNSGYFQPNLADDDTNWDEYPQRLDPYRDAFRAVLVDVSCVAD